MAKVNYTPEMVETAVTMYKESGNQAIPAIAKVIGRTEKSVIAKLVREKVYIAPSKPVKAPKDDGPTKKELLAELFSRAGREFDGLEGASKAAINTLIECLPSAE